MRQNRTTDPLPRVVASLALLVALAGAVDGCGGGSSSNASGAGTTPAGQVSPTDTAGTSGDTAGASQTDTTFVAPFSMTVPDWVGTTPSESTAHFVTWESADQTRGIRVLAPVEVYRPGSSKPSPPPRHMAAYLTALRRSGALITDVSHPTIDGLPGIELTVAAPAGNSLDGALGCPEPGLAAPECYGPQDELVLRLVCVEVDGDAVLIWEKDPSDGAGAIDYASFDAMIESLDFT